MRIEARTAYPSLAASARVRIVGFVEYLAEHGVDLEYLPSLTDSEYAVLTSNAGRMRKLRSLISGASRVISNRHTHGETQLVHRLLSLTALPGLDPPRRLHAYDFDDALYLGAVGVADRGASILKREAQRWRTYVTRAHLVLAGNNVLAAHATEYARGQVEIVPSCIEPTRYRMRRHCPSPTVTIGWIGSPTTSGYLGPVITALERINRGRAEPLGRLIVIGGSAGYSAPWLEERRWSLECEPYEVSQFDIGVMPMPDSEWARGKCGFKLLQYFAAGVPVVASPVGVAPALVGKDRGLLATSIGTWETAFRELARDELMRMEMGERGRLFVEREFSYARWAPELASMLKQLS